VLASAFSLLALAAQVARKVSPRTKLIFEKLSISTTLDTLTNPCQDLPPHPKRPSKRPSQQSKRQAAQSAAKKTKEAAQPAAKRGPDGIQQYFSPAPRFRSDQEQSLRSSPSKRLMQSQSTDNSKEIVELCSDQENSPADSPVKKKGQG